MALLGAQPAVYVYQQHVNNLLPEEKDVFYKDSFALAFSDWRNLSPAYRDFFVSLIKSERQRFIDFVRNDTFNWVSWVTSVLSSVVDVLGCKG